MSKLLNPFTKSVNNKAPFQHFITQKVTNENLFKKNKSFEE